MPASEPLPTLQELANAYHGALVSERRHGDTHEGSIHDHWAGVGALLWRRMVERDQQEFQALYFSNAVGARLDAYVAKRWPTKQRVADTPGQGVIRLRRATTAAGAGLFFARTRIAVGSGGAQQLRYYEVVQDTPCGATTTEPLPVAIQAVKPGRGSKIQARRGEVVILRFEDALWDNSWIIEELLCDDGTTKEEDPAFRARLETEAFEDRPGFESAIIKAMKACGAATVLLFRSDYQGEANDHGLNRIYVGDINFESTPELLRKCRLALPAVAMAGASNQVLAMTTRRLQVGVGISMWDSPEKFDTEAVTLAARAAVVEHFASRENPFLWSLAGIRGAVLRAIQDTQNITITSSLPAPTAATFFDAYPLPRYQLVPNDVTITLTPPTP